MIYAPTLKTMTLFEKHSVVTNEMVAEFWGISPHNAKLRLRSLRRLGLVELIGKGKGCRRKA